MAFVKKSGARRSKPRMRFENRRVLLLEIFDSLHSTFGPQHWWPIGGKYLGGPQNSQEGSQQALPGAAASRASGSACDRQGRGGIGSKASRPPHSDCPGGIGGATAPHGPPDSNAAFEVMVGAILTQNTAWTNVEKALENLRSVGCLTPGAVRGMSTKQLASLLRPSGYFNIKAQRLKSFVSFLYQEYRGDVRRMLKEDPALLREKLLSVKGIGPETADSILLYAGGFPWFVVDAYTRRILARHGLVAARVNYEDLQDFFMKDLPQDTKLYNEYHALLVKLGKEICRQKPLCEQCPLLEVLGEPVFIA